MQCQQKSALSTLLSIYEKQDIREISFVIFSFQHDCMSTIASSLIIYIAHEEF